MSKVIGIFAFLLLTLPLTGLMEWLGAAVSSGLKGEKPPRLLQAVIKPVLLYRKPWGESPKEKLTAFLHLAFAMAGGSVFFAGGSIALSFLLLVFAEAVMVYKIGHNERDPLSTGFESETASASYSACQLFLAAAGFYCFNRLLYYKGSFLVSGIVSSQTAPSFYMPAMLMGFIWMLVNESGIGLSSIDKNCEYLEKEQAMYESGRRFRKATLFGVLFIFNYGGTVLSALISGGICLLVWLFGLLLHEPYSRPWNPRAASAVSAVLLIASFINLFVLFQLTDGLR